MPVAEVRKVVGVGDQYLVGGAHDARRWCLIVAQLGEQRGFPACGGTGGDLVSAEFGVGDPAKPPGVVLVGDDVAKRSRTPDDVEAIGGL